MKTFNVACLAVILLGASRHAHAAPLDPPSPEAIAEARRIVEAMKANPRGPFERLRWFCNDGTIHPPQPPPCAERGGGEQHGEHSAQHARLAELGFHAGTVFAALTWDELWSSQPRAGRLRELALERYMVDVDDGFVLRLARDYRGAFQIEDEERDGRVLLLRLLEQPGLVENEFLLARESVRVIPHLGEGGDRTREIRRSSKDLADKDRSFERIRIRIHNNPSLGDAQATRAWREAAAAAGKNEALLAQADTLAQDIDLVYGPAGRHARLQAAAARARAAGGLGEQVAARLDAAAAAGAPAARVEALTALLVDLRSTCAADTNPGRRLRMLDLSLDAEGEALASALEALRAPDLSRAALLRLAASLVEGAHGAGFLSLRERDELAAPALALWGRESVGASEALAAARALERAAAWAAGTVRATYAEALVRWTALDPKAAHFTDDLLRSSVLLPLADAASRLARDAEAAAGLSHAVLGAPLGGLAGLNPGVAVGMLRIVGEAQLHAGGAYSATDIVVLPATVSELSPVAGILTVSEGNALSHVQMLARNLGIPNAVVPPSALERLRPADGQRVLLAVGANGVVVLERAASVDPALLDVVTGAALAAAASQKVQAPEPDLGVARLLTLAELESSLSGRVVGPKAANVGELARLFPGRVAPAIALPFGLYAEHAGGIKARLAGAYQANREGSLDEAGLARAIDEARASLEALVLSDRTRAALAKVATDQFGPDGTYGVFVRSDTNVEDLPQFTGAGLNKTVPHVIGLEHIAAAVPKVWGSAFTQRAMAWRARALTNPEDVYPSVLLMKSVPCDKSGVLVTADLATGGQGVTVSTAWGVGGAVDGESAETIVLRPDGRVTVVAEAKAPWRRRLAATGGVEWVPAAIGRVLDDGEIAQLRDFVTELSSRLAPAAGDDERPLPWDVEFGFASGQLVLFQVRPLVERGAALADRVVRQVAPVSSVQAATLDLASRPLAP